MILLYFFGITDYTKLSQHLDRLLSEIETIQLAPDFSICRILNGMWQVAGSHGQIDSELAVQDMKKYQEFGFTTWDLADIYGPAESLVGDFKDKTASDFQAFTKFVPNPGPMSNSIVTYYIEESLKKMKVGCIDANCFLTQISFDGMSNTST